MKFVMPFLVFVLCYLVALHLLQAVGLSAVVQLVGGVLAGYLAVQPVQKYYDRREAKRITQGIFGDQPSANPAHASSCRACGAQLGEVAQSMAMQHRPMTYCPACGEPTGTQAT